MQEVPSFPPLAAGQVFFNARPFVVKEVASAPLLTLRFTIVQDVAFAPSLDSQYDFSFQPLVMQ